MEHRSVKGMKDVMPPESCQWQKTESIAREIFRRCGYREIITPIMEETALFTKSVGEDTDIVKKEMFSFQDRGERDISLRPEGTAPIVRAYLEHNIYKTEPFQKLYYIGPMFRAERPQAGRLRQFQQIGIEAIGSDYPALDADIITVLKRLLDAIGIKDYKIRLNNLGCREDKKKLSGALKKTFAGRTDIKLLCDDCRRRAETNPLRLLDCKNKDCKMAVRNHFENIDFLCAACKDHFKEVLRLLDMLKIKYEIDPYMVRGLDYYTRTVFEVTHGDLGSQNAVGAGGRYDDLIHDMGGPKVGACGFAIGVERILMSLAKAKDEKSRAGVIDIFVAILGKAAFDKGLSLLDELRDGGIASDMDYRFGSLKSQMGKADNLKAKFVLIVGDDEISKGEAVLRDMTTKEQVAVKFSEIINTLKAKLC